MRLGLNIGYSGATIGDVLPLVRHAEKVGFDSVWVAEAYGSDAVSVLGALAASTERIQIGSAIMQIPARTPACTAMTAMTLDALSGGRFLLGLGVSGPQVVEGWHGVPYGKPLRRTREYVEVVRAAIAREAPLTYDGAEYQIPYQGPDATGLGKPLRSILHPVRPSIPIYLAAIGPRNVALAGEIADGWMPIFWAPEREADFTRSLDEGLARAGRPAYAVDIAVQVPVVVDDDTDDARNRLKPMLALYIGGMGAKGQNFYHRLATNYGYGEAADRIQDAYLGGRKMEAVMAVPDALVDELSLVGPAGRIRERLTAWTASRATTMIVQTHQPEALELIRDAVG